MFKYNIMGKIDKKIIKEFNATRNNTRFLCNAPFCAMAFSIGGLVSPCGRNTNGQETITGKSISEIWNGNKFKQHRKNIKNNILSHACCFCEDRLTNKIYEQVPIQQFESFNIKRLGRKDIQSIQLITSNKCNLKCIMCNEIFSSQFEKVDTYKQETIYNDAFYNEIIEYIPKLKELICIGGEPFLINEYYKLWDKVVETNPQCKISVVTNGTILNDKIKEIVERANFNIQISFEATTKETYESIRRNANYESVLKNIEYFGSLMKKQGKTLTIPACVLKQNRHEIPDLVRFCNTNNFYLNLLTVCASKEGLWDMPSEYLKELKHFYKEQKFDECSSQSKHNIKTFKDDLMHNMDKWIFDAQCKENFETLYDLKQDKVESLKEKLYMEIDNVIKETSNSYEDYTKKRDFSIEKLNNIIQNLPDYFNTNHLYSVLTKASAGIIVQYLLLCNSNTMKNIFEEIFYYNGWTH